MASGRTKDARQGVEQLARCYASHCLTPFEEEKCRLGHDVLTGHITHIIMTSGANRSKLSKTWGFNDVISHLPFGRYKERRDTIIKHRQLENTELRNLNGVSCLVVPKERVDPDDEFRGEDGSVDAFKYSKPGEWLYHEHR
eukprot:4992774-Ditylum_brightwellii.AAC.2